MYSVIILSYLKLSKNLVSNSFWLVTKFFSLDISYRYILNDISQQDDALPMWIPQMVMVIGTFILATAFIDRLYQTIFFNYDELEIKWKVKDEKAIDQVNVSRDKYYGE